MIRSLLAPVALAISGAALAAALVTLLSSRRPATALGVLLDLLLAAGLLRLAGTPSWHAIAVSAAIVLLRRLIGTGLRLGGRTWTRGRPLVDRLPRVPPAVRRRLTHPAWRL